METTREREQNQSRMSSAKREGVRQSLLTNDNIRQLLEMLENPDAYSEQEIHDIINHDDATRETYSLMIEAKRINRHRLNDESVDVDAAWQRFNQRLRPYHGGFNWMKTAAIVIGVLLVSGITYATIHIARNVGGDINTSTPTHEDRISDSPQPVTSNSADTLAGDTTSMHPIIYDNIPLEKMLPEIAAHYDIQVIFSNDDTRQLRFRFVWNPQHDIEQVVNDLNQFERLNVTLNENQITIE